MGWREKSSRGGFVTASHGGNQPCAELTASV
jgi:hypothetical protein